MKKKKGNKTGKGWFKPGITGNPKGRPSMPQEYNDFKRLSALQYKELVDKYFGMTIKELKEYLNNNRDRLPAVEVWLLKVMNDGMQEGNPGVLDMILNRTIGRPTQKIDIGGRLNVHIPTDVKLLKKWRNEDKK
ncbi:MAG: DUF5681 domain-containing protein [Elusimicrobiota bacterium]|jgi:hypothetical protein|nr:DUF5681 domain-containing protein [Elusimicrobiota bacterium]